MRILVLLAALLPLAASAQSDDIFEQFSAIAGYETGAQVAEQLGAPEGYDAARFEEGLRAGLAQDSSVLSYVTGFEVGQGLARYELPIDVASFIAALQAAVMGETAPFTDMEKEAAFATIQDTLYMRELRAAALEDSSAARGLREIEANEAASRLALSEIATRDSVTATGTGLLYSITQPGTGLKPEGDSWVRVAYAGRLLDGTEFDASEPGEPTTFNLERVIRGFREALSDMREGESRTIWVPPGLAYGYRGAPPAIGPSMALRFDLTLVEARVAPPSPPPMPPPPPRGN